MTTCGRLGRQTSARLKITFVDMTYPGQRPEPPSLSSHFLLVEPLVEQLVTWNCLKHFLWIWRKLSQVETTSGKDVDHITGQVNGWLLIILRRESIINREISLYSCYDTRAKVISIVIGNSPQGGVSNTRERYCYKYMYLYNVTSGGSS